MNEPRRPADPPEEGAKPDTNPTGHAPHGVPHGAEDEHPMGTPSSDRAKTETVVKKT